MAKGKAKINSSEGVALPQPRTLRSRKRECPSDEISQTEEVQAALHQQDAEGHNTAMINMPLQCLQSPLQEYATITNQQDKTAAQSCLTKQYGSTEEKHTEEEVKASEGQEETTVLYLNNDSQLQGFTVNPENYTSKGGKEEITPQEVTRSPFQTYTDQHQALTFEEGDGSCATALENQLGAKKNSQCNVESNHETSSTCMGDVKVIAKESAVGLPARKKRRMGMCGLTEKERSQFLQTQKRENGQNGAERVEKQICNNTADLATEEENKSPPPLPSSPLPILTGSVTEQSEAEIKLQSSHCRGDDRAETEVCITVTASDGPSALCYPGCSEGKSCEAEEGTVSSPEETGEPKSDPPTEEKVEGHLGNPEQQEIQECTANIPEKQRKDEEDGCADFDCSLVITLSTNLSQNEGAEKKKDGSDAAPLHVHSVTKTRGERNEEMMGDVVNGAEAGASSSDTRPGGFSCGSVELCDAERKDSYDPDVEPAAGPSTVNTENSQTRDTTDPFGSGYLDYVSDSQLNSIALIEEEMMEREEDPGFSHCHEDATDLICGLIRELSSLNQKVMATHRELENLRRGSKTSRNSR